MKCDHSLRIAERWKLLRDDFDSMRRDYPNISVEVYKPNTKQKLTIPVGGFRAADEFRHDAWTLNYGGYPTCPRNVLLWLVRRAILLFDETIKSFDWTFADPTLYSDSRQSIKDFLEQYEDRVKDKSVFPGNKYVSFLLWFNGGARPVIPMPCALRVCRDACSYFTEVSLQHAKHENDPPHGKDAYVILRIDEIADYFGLSETQARTHLKDPEKIIAKKLDGRHGYEVAVFSLTTDWKERIAAGKVARDKKAAQPKRTTKTP